MAWSQLRNEKAEAVEALLGDLPRYPDEFQVVRRDEAVDLIHAVVWLLAVRKGSTAEVYAWTALADALGVERMTSLLGLCDAKS